MDKNKVISILEHILERVIDLYIPINGQARQAQRRLILDIKKTIEDIENE